MKKTESLKKNDQFKKVFNKGKWLRGKYIVLYIYQNKLEINRLGIAVGKKTGNSVKRNKIKRLIRESYRYNEDSILNGYDIIILWKYKENEVVFSSLRDDITSLFKKSVLWRKDE